MNYLLNLPWTLLGLLSSLLSLPKKVTLNKSPRAVVVSVQSFWWYSWLPGMKGARAMAIGNVVLLGPNILDKDLEHELVHTEQFNREPLIHPLLYSYQTFKHGYRNNKYEKEAYDKAGNVYKS